MRQRSDTWIRLAARGNFRMESIAIINGVEYTAISAPIINRALISDNLSVGNCISATLKLSILTDDKIGKAAKIVIKARITDDVEYSEWMEFGTFYIDNRAVDSGLVTVQCYDSMLKASQTYGDETNPEDRIGWPKTMQTCVKEIAARIGVEIDPRTVIKTAAPYQVPYPNKMSMMQVLGYIGACHGGNWVITPENKLRLVPLLSPPAETYDIIDHDYNQIYTGDGHKLVWQHTETGETVEHKAGGGLINVPIVIGKIATSRAFTITRVILARDEELGYALGDDTGYTLIIESNPYACQAICDDLYAELNGMEYYPYTITSACYDPAAELGDWIIVGDKVRSVLYSENATLNVDYRVTASATGKDEVGSEYPYLTSIQRLQMEQEQIKKYTESEKDEIYSKIEQTHTDILLQVGGVYATMESVEKVNAAINLTAEAISAEVKRSTEADGEMSSLITQTAEKIDLKVSKGDVSSQISVETGTVTIGSNRLVINSDNFKLSGSGEVEATGSISSVKGKLRTDVSAGKLSFYYDGSQTGVLQSNVNDAFSLVEMIIHSESMEFWADSRSSWTNLCYVINNGWYDDRPERNLFFNGIRSIDGDIFSSGELVFGYDSQRNFVDSGEVRVYKSLYADTNTPGLVVDGSFLCTTGDLWSEGEKYRVVSTENYGRVGLSAMESAAALFSDIGSGTVDDSGVTYIYLEPVFAETVDTAHEYQVFVSAYDCAAISKIEKHDGFFVVRGTPGTTFDWILFARQKDYATNRLESVNVAQNTAVKVDNSIFYGDEKGATQSQTYMNEFPDTYDEQAEAYLKDYELEVTNYGN